MADGFLPIQYLQSRAASERLRGLGLDSPRDLGLTHPGMLRQNSFHDERRDLSSDRTKLTETPHRFNDLDPLFSSQHHFDA